MSVQPPQDKIQNALIETCRVKMRTLFDHPSLQPGYPIGTIRGRCKSDEEILAALDLTLLKPSATEDDIRALCKKARLLEVATVCVNPIHLALTTSLLQDSNTKPICVVGFPLGASSAVSVAAEAREAIVNGACEIDMVLPAGLLAAEDYANLLIYLETVIKPLPVPVKVILETCLHDDTHIIEACLLCVVAGAAFVKTSTGFGAAGASTHHVSLMRKVVGNSIGVKASGGIRSFATANEMFKAGANRIGASGLE